MEFEGMKIGPVNQEVKPEQKPVEEKKQGAGSDILKKVKDIRSFDSEEVIYGVYNNANAKWSVKLNDFFIDHSGVDLKEKSYFFHMLAVMVDAGIPVVQSLKSLALRSQNKRFRRVLSTIGHNAENGATLSDAMNRFDDVFDQAELGIIQSGEATGRLHTMLFKLSSQLDARHDLYMKLWGAAVYPIAVFSVLILVATGMLVWIFPTLLGLLQDGGIGMEDLPLATRFLIVIQDVITNYWWAVLLFGFGLYGLFKMYVGSSYGATKWDYFKLKMPVVGTLIRKVYVLRFVSLLGILIESGLPVIKALTITKNAISNRIYRLKIDEVVDAVGVGGKISQSLMDSEYLFPPEVVQMLGVGEASASIGKVAEKVASQYQREIDNSLKRLTSVFEPIMILFVGVSVALLALAVMAPIFNLSTSVGV